METFAEQGYTHPRWEDPGRAPADGSRTAEFAVAAVFGRASGVYSAEPSEVTESGRPGCAKFTESVSSKLVVTELESCAYMASDLGLWVFRRTAARSGELLQVAPALMVARAQPQLRPQPQLQLQP